MALAARPMHVPAGTGIDESTRAEHLDPAASSLTNVNVRADRRGGFSKRLGYAYLGLGRLDATTRSAGRKLFSHGDRCCVVDGTHLDVYSETAGAWSTIGRVPEASYRLLDVPNPSAAASTASYVEDVAIVGSYLVVLYSAGAQVVVASVLDLAGTVLRAPEVIFSTGAYAGLGVYGTTVCLLANDYATNTEVRLWTLDASSASGINTGWTARGTVATDVRLNNRAFHVQGLEDRVAFAYVNDSAGTNRVTVKTVTTAGAVDSVTINTLSNNPTAVAIEGSSADTLWVAWNEAANVSIQGLTGNNLAATLATKALAVSPAVAPTADDLRLITTGTGAARVYCNDGTSGAIQSRTWTTSAGAPVMGAGTTWYSLYIVSRIFARGGRYYAFCMPSIDPIDGTCVLCELDPSASTARPVVHTEPGLTYPAITRRCNILAVGSKAYSALSLLRGASEFSASLIEIDFASTSRWQAVEHAGSTYLTGGVTMKFDGSRLREAGFIAKPGQPTSSTNAGAVLNPATGYRWVAVYEALDGDGNWIQSGVSTPSSLSSTGAFASFTVAVRTLGLTSRFATWSTAAAERVAFYRTTDGGSVYYRIGAVANSTGAATVSIADATTDAALIANAKLYGTGAYPGTAGAGQDRRAPPGFSCLVSYNDMLVGATGSTLWHSSQSVVGEAVWFNPLFRLDMVDGGEVTALAAQDGTLYVFKRRSIFAVNGEPPADNGSSGGLGTPRRLAADVGCIDPRSVVVTALGVFFQSERGLELLSRGQSVEWIGEQVSETLSSYPVITSATLDSAHAIVRFACAASETDNAVGSTGVHLVFDLRLRTWVSVDKVFGSVAASTAAQSAAMVYLSGRWRYAWLETSGYVYYEQADSWLDNSGTQWVAMQWETANFRMGLQQEQRIWSATFLYERHSACGLEVEIAYDYAGTYDAPKTWTEAEVLAGARQLEVRPKPRGQAQRYRFTDTAPAVFGTGKGCTWIGISVDIAPKQGSTRGTPRLDPSVRK